MNRQPLERISRVRRAEEVRQQLQRAIEQGDFGHQLPSEREIAQTLDVSRVTVREALRELESSGWIEIRHGRGCFVLDRLPDGYADRFSGWLDEHKDEVLELLRVRGALDEVAAELAAGCRDVAALDAISKASQHFTDLAMTPAFTASTVDQIVEADISLHAAIASASGSQLVAKLLADLNDSLAQSRRLILSSRERALASAAEHDALVQSILSSDPRSAKLAAERHWASVRASMIEPSDGQNLDARVRS
jgi:GntR family transcriptional regulator, transcriptional repressor for pyruvate dehydrogenase complex